MMAPDGQRRDGQGVDAQFLLGAFRRLNKTLRLRPLLFEIRNLTLEALEAEGVSLLVWNDAHTQLEFHLAFNEVPETRHRPTLEPGQGMAGWIVENDQAVVSHDVSKDPRFSHEFARQAGFVGRSLLGVPLYRAGIVFGAIVVLNKRRGAFGERDLATLRTLADPISIALDNALTFQIARRERAQNEALYRVGLVLSRKMDLEEISETLLDQLLKVVPYDAAAMYLLDGQGGILEWFQQRGYPEGTVDKIHLKLGQGAVGWAAGSGEALILGDVRSDSRYVSARPETNSEMVVPILAEGNVIGVLNLEADALDYFTVSDLRVARAFANQASISIVRGRLYRESRDRARLQHELVLARSIQRKFLPSAAPSVPGYEIAGTNRPSTEVSGDAFDYITLTPTQIGIFIADVAGKGVSAALILATLRASLRTEAAGRYSIAEIVSRVNRLIWESVDPGQFATAVYGVLDTENGVFSYVNAGHERPFLLRARGTLERLSAGGLLLGLDPSTPFELGRITMEPGDVLLLFTDGATEAGAPAGEAFGEDRLGIFLRDQASEPLPALLDGIVREVEVFSGGNSLEDDVTLVALRRSPSEPA